MKEWINGDCDRADALAAQDPYFLELSAQRRELEHRYLEILNSLTESEREVMIEYEYLTSELAYQRTQAAYRVGRGIG